MADQYYTNIASYQQAKATSKRFSLSVHMNGGGTLTSSTFYPIEHLEEIIAAIESTDQDGMFFLWSKEENQLRSVIKEQIRYITVQFD